MGPLTAAAPTRPSADAHSRTQQRVAMPAAEGSLAERLRAKLLDKQLPLPQRFRVLFSLRGLAGKEAADALLDGEIPTVSISPVPPLNAV